MEKTPSAPQVVPVEKKDSPKRFSVPPNFQPQQETNVAPIPESTKRASSLQQKIQQLQKQSSTSQVQVEQKQEVPLKVKRGSILETFNEKVTQNTKKEEKKIQSYDTLYFLVFGETGAGKSTLINTLHLWAMDKPLQDCKELVIPNPKFPHFKISEAYKKFASESFLNGNTKTSESQTNSATFYEFNLQLQTDNGLKKQKVVMMDTPGFADTRGEEQDKENIKGIVDSILGRRLPHINGIIFMINGSIARSAALVTVVKELKEVFPKGFENNFAILFSNVPDKQDANNSFATEFESETKIKISRIFKYNNRLLEKDYTSLPNKPSDPKQVDRKTRYYEDVVEDFDDIKSTLSDIFQQLAMLPARLPTPYVAKVMQPALNKVLSNMINKSNSE